LVVAGGANFPDGKPWEGGVKRWYDTVYVLDTVDAEWRVVGKLPRALGYGVTFSTDEGMICVGGSDAEGHHAEVFLLRLGEQGLVTEFLPSLPRSCANFCGVKTGSVLTVLGGIETPDAVSAAAGGWRLDLRNLEAGWLPLEPWPGSGRMLAVAGTAGDEVYLVGGTALRANAEGVAERVLLKDGFAWHSERGWRQLPELLDFSVAAPTPLVVRDGGMLLVGGDDGRQMQVNPVEHRGFPRVIQRYDLVEEKGEKVGTAPAGVVTTTSVEWNGLAVIPGGELRPGVRSTEVWGLELMSRADSSQ
jgi:N-acetylneuraminic acid mutarotase